MGVVSVMCEDYQACLMYAPSVCSRFVLVSAHSSGIVVYLRQDVQNGV